MIVDINLFYQLASISLVESSKQLGINLKWKIQETLSMIAIHFDFSPPPVFPLNPLTLPWPAIRGQLMIPALAQTLHSKI